MSKINFQFQDVLSSFVVLLVAIPLCLGISIAVGLSPTVGLISGVIGGIVVSSLGGAPLQVSGPAAGLITVVWEITQEHGVEHLGIIVLCAGLLQIGLSFLKVGQWFRAVSPAIIHGMLAGIGLLIFASQFHVMVDDKASANWFENVASIPASVWKGLIPSAETTHHLAAIIGVMTIAIIMLWQFMPKKMKLLPAPLVAVLVAVITSSVFAFPIKYVTVPENLMAGINWVSLDHIPYIFQHSVMLAIVTVALVASMESLLTAVSIDKLHTGPKANYDKELFGQGVGNTIAGIFGALPITGVIVRSAANIQAGAKTRASGLLHGVWLLLFMVCFPALLKLIPVSALAAILVYTGYKLVHTEAIKDLWEAGRFEFAIYVVTALSIVSFGLLDGILIGVALAAIRFMMTQSNLEIKVNYLAEDANVYVHLLGNANFVCLPRFTSAMESLPAQKTVHICLSDVAYIDHACLEFLTSWQKQYTEAGGDVIIEGDISTCKYPVTQKTIDKLQQSNA